MPTFQFEAMDATGAEIKDVIEAPTEEEAQATIRQMGYFVTKITAKKAHKKAEATGAKKKRGFVFGGVKSRELTTFTRQLSILQDAGLPILRSLRILAGQAKPGRLKYSLEDTCEEIEGGSTLSEGMAKTPKFYTRLYVNMIKAGEAGGALELILQRLADFQERAESLKRKVKGAMIYPIVVVTVAVGILTFIMIKIVPEFEKIFLEFDLPLPRMTELSVPGFHPVSAFFWFCFVGGPIGLLIYLLKYKQRIVDDIVVNMVDVGEETGELDTMLYKVADTYDEEVAVLTEGLTKLMEPLLIIFLGGGGGFFLISLFVPLG